MSLLNFIGGGRKTVVPSKPIVATANPEAVHAQLSNPSQQAAMGTSTPTLHSRNRPSHSQPDSVSFTTHLPTQSSRSSTVYSTVRPSKSNLSPAESQLSLVESLDDETLLKEVPSHSVNFLKASTLLEQDWMDVGKDSSDEDVFLSDNDHDTGGACKDHQK